MRSEQAVKNKLDEVIEKYLIIKDMQLNSDTDPNTLADALSYSGKLNGIFHTLKWILEENDTIIGL